MEMHQLDKRLRRMLQELNQLTVMRKVPVEGIQISPRGEDAFEPFENGGLWGETAEWWDFKFSVTIPEDFHGQATLVARTGREAEWEAVNPQFVVKVNGRIEQAFDTKHTTCVLMEHAAPGARFDVELNGYVPVQPGQVPPRLNLSLEDVDDNVVQLVYDLYVPWEAACILKEGERDRELTLKKLSDAINLLDLRRPHSPEFEASVSAARAFLDEEYYKVREQLPAEAVASCVGHTHIDVAWLWDLYQTRHKAVRSFSTVLKLMELYPDYKFMSSQPVLYKFVKEDAPELYERIKQRVAEGRWEVEGGMWVEADCNLTSGESMVRQFLHGQEFFRKEFGKESRVLWLPDVFGYSAALPQIMKLAGVDYFMTSKLSWSEFNLSPYDTFVWKGINGSEVLTHFTPAREMQDDHSDLAHYTTYNAMIKPSQMVGGWRRFQQKALDNEFLVSFGYGDGGGGPTDWMLENARRLGVPLPGTPVVKQQHAKPFFEHLEERVKDDPRLPKWSGELYLEYHRGTYTAIARNKRNNRKIELKLRDVELWCSYANQRVGMPYPAETLHAIWEDVLTLQFHDILPGSSIKKVYDDSDEMYARMFKKLEAIEAEALAALGKEAAGDLVLYNSLSYERDDVVFFDAPEDVTAIKNAAGELFPVQRVDGRACAFVKGLPAMGALSAWFVKGEPAKEAMQVCEKGFDTPFFQGTFDASMRITSLVDKKSGRELAKAGQSLNRIVCYENKPHDYDAWDINIYYNQRHWEVDQLTGVELVSSGPVLSLLRAHYRYMDSTLDQDIYLYHDLPRIDFDTHVDWKEKQYLLKAHFPMDVFYNEATFDIQYGNVKRATHKNTSWDVARFEVCAHKWADVSEDGFGASLMNDCKYGYSVDEQGMALTLLKSSLHPNEEGDLTTHHFTYSLMPHENGWREADTVKQAYQLNIPVLAGPATGSGSLPSLARVEQPGVLIEAVKQQLDGTGIVVRLYECFGRRNADVALQLGFPVKSAVECNLLERPIQPVTVAEGTIHFELKPYEIKSFLLDI